MKTSGDEHGFVLVAALALLSLTFLLGGLMIGLGSLEMLHSASDCWGRQALYTADAGLEEAKVRLLDDWLTSSSWHDGAIGEVQAPVCENQWGELLGWRTLRDCRYRVLYQHLPGDPRSMVVRAEATAGGGRGVRGVEGLFRPVGGVGVLTLLHRACGPIDVQGSCWIWGAGAGESVLRFGARGMRNHYEDVPDPLHDHIPACPTVEQDGELVQWLGATLWVKSGNVESDGGSVGEPDLAGNDVAELLDMVVCGGDLPLDRHALAERRSPSNWPTFPSLDAPFPCGEYCCYREFYRRGGEAPLWPGDLRLVPPLRDGAFGGASGDSLVWHTENGRLNLYVSGSIEIAGALHLGSAAWPVAYRGVGHIHCGGDVVIGGDVLPVGLLGADDLLGISTDGNVTLTASGADVQAGLFLHADGTVTVADGTVDFAGALNASQLDAPDGARFYEVPAASHRLCCAPDRWSVTYGNTRKEAYALAE
jgi:hypothetical protein